jgi:heterodisulfide reductase subunit A-like polyferredoxin
VTTGVIQPPGAKGPGSWPLARPPRALETTVPGVFAAGHLRQQPAHGIRRAIQDGVAAAEQAMTHILEQLHPSNPGRTTGAPVDPGKPLP